ncbi:phage holin family protein [Myxococcota bacterium]|nr:phage holin family protein [Myxococcota bacterium]
MRPLVVLLCIAIASTGRPALAEGEASPPSIAPTPRAMRSADPFGTPESEAGRVVAQVPTDDASRVGEVEARIAALESQRDAISTRGPRAAVITGSVMTGVGAGLAAVAGILCAAAAAGSSTRCRVENAAGIAGGGAAVAIAGIITLVSGRSRLKQRNQEREVFQKQIDSLKRTRAALPLPNIGFTAGRGSDPGLVLGWRF